MILVTYNFTHMQYFACVPHMTLTYLPNVINLPHNQFNLSYIRAYISSIYAESGVTCYICNALCNILLSI